MAQPLRIGMIGLDTSHVVAFTNLLNNPADPNHVPGGKVVVAFPGGSKDFPLSINRVAGFTKDLNEKHGVKIVDSPEAVAEACDLLFIESVDGRVHLDQFRRTVKFKRPTFIDKPFTVSSTEAKQIVSLAKDAGVPVMSCSALRYAENLHKHLSQPAESVGGAIVGCDATGPMSIEPTQPGLFWYGIHTVEVLYTVMGPGCKSVSTVTNNDFDLVTGVWADGRVATVRGHRKGHSKFAVTIHREKDLTCLDLNANQRPYYACLLDQIMANLPQGKTPINPEISLEIVRFIEAANESRATTGRSVAL